MLGETAPSWITHPRDTQNIIRVVCLHHCPSSNDNQVDHPCHYGISEDDRDNALDSALFAQALALLRVDEVRMFRFEIGFDAGSGILKLCRSHKAVRAYEIQLV